jgi:ATP-binding cassette subfamily B protein
MLSFSLLAAAFNFLSGYGTQKVAELGARTLRQRLYGHIQLLPWDELQKAPTGDWVQRCTSDVDTLRRLAGLQFPELVTSSLQALWILPLLFSLEPRLAWFTVPLLPVVLVFSYLFFKKVEDAFKESDESEGRLSGILQENVTGVRVVKAFARQEFERERFGRENDHYRNVTRKLINLFALYWGLVNVLALLQLGIVLTAGILLVHQGLVTTGTVVMFMTLTGMLVWPIRNLGRVLTDLGKAKVSWARVQEILHKQTEELGEREVPVRTWNGRLEFRHVSVTKEGRPILCDLSFVIEAGQTAALLGPTGSGKSTLVQLLAGLTDYDGEILLDERELRTLSKRELRAQVGLVLQEPWLFAKTIGANIGLAHREPRHEEVVMAASLARFHDGIAAFPQGYETLLGERGVTLSGGQRQRTAIAQMLLRPRPVLIFDDSLSAVDNHTDAAIRQALLSRPDRGTVVLISHRLSTLSQADTILVLEAGRLVQQGTHRDLVAVPGLYLRMAELQNALQKEWETS